MLALLINLITYQSFLLIVIYSRVAPVVHWQGSVWLNTRQQGNGLFNDALNTFYLQLYGVRRMVKDHSDNERGNPLLTLYGLFSISSKGSFICTAFVTPIAVHWLERKIVQCVHHEGWIWWPIAPWALLQSYISLWTHISKTITHTHHPTHPNFTFQPVLHNWCNKGCGMCYPVCGMMHIKEPLLLIRKNIITILINPTVHTTVLL